MFPAEVTRAPDGLTDDEVALIKAKSDPLSETEIEWDSLENEDEKQDDGLAGIHETGLPGEPEP